VAGVILLEFHKSIVCFHCFRFLITVRDCPPFDGARYEQVYHAYGLSRSNWVRADVTALGLMCTKPVREYTARPLFAWLQASQTENRVDGAAPRDD